MTNKLNHITTVKTSNLLNALKQVQTFKNKTGGKVLCHTLLEVLENGIRLVGTDGIRLGLRDVYESDEKLTSQEYKGKQFIITNENILIDILKNFDKYSSTDLVIDNETNELYINQFNYNATQYQVIYLTDDLKYPNISGIINNDNNKPEYEIKVSRELLKNILSNTTKLTRLDDITLRFYGRLSKIEIVNKEVDGFNKEYNVLMPIA